MFDPQTEELTFIAGDKAVHQRRREHHGGAISSSSTVHLDKAALGHPLIRYRNRLIEADVYPLLGAPVGEDGKQAIEVIIICPRCEHELRISSLAKSVHWEPGAAVLDVERQAMVFRGQLSVEPFTCTWEINTKTPVTGHGENLCRWRVGIDKGLALDA